MTGTSHGIVALLCVATLAGCVEAPPSPAGESISAEAAGDSTLVRESGTTRHRVTGACADAPPAPSGCVGVIENDPGRFTVDAPVRHASLSVRWDAATRPDGEWEVWVADADGERWSEGRTGMGAQPVTFPLRPLVPGTYTVEARPIATGVGLGSGEVGWTVSLVVESVTSTP